MFFSPSLYINGDEFNEAKDSQKKARLFYISDCLSTQNYFGIISLKHLVPQSLCCLNRFIL